MSHEEAVVAVDLIVQGVPRSTASWGAQFMAYRRVEKSGSLREQAVALATLYAEPQPDTPRRLMIERLEKALLPKLASLTNTTEGELRARIRSGSIVFQHDAPHRPEALAPISAPPFVPKGWTPECAFRVFGGAVTLGQPGVQLSEFEGPAVHAIQRPARNGTWFHFGLSNPTRGFPDVIVHEEALPKAVQLLEAVTLIAEVVLVDGRSWALDAECHRDRDTLAIVKRRERLNRGTSTQWMGRSARWYGVAGETPELVLLALS